jgi:hypothetical protein
MKNPGRAGVFLYKGTLPFSHIRPEKGSVPFYARPTPAVR